MILKMICWSQVVLLISCLAYSNGALEMSSDKSRELLMKKLLSNYQPSSRPGRLNETLMIFLDIELQHFDYKERNGAFQFVGLMQVRWRDPKLVWSPLDFGNMTHVTVSQRQIWVPDLEFYNNAPNKFIRMHRNGFVSVKNDGVVFWSDNVDVHTTCLAYVQNWPHDKHECQISLGSWVFDGMEVDIMHVNPNASISFRPINKQNMKYKVTQFVGSHNAKYYSCCQQPYITMEYNITFERETTYAIIFRAPGLTVIMFTLLALNMEPWRVEKFWLNAMTLWLIAANLLYFAINSHLFSKDIPNVVKFFSTSLVLVTLSQLVAVFCTYAVNSKFKPQLCPGILRIINASWTRHLVAINKKINNSRQQENNATDFNEEKLDDISCLLAQQLPQNDWHRLAKLLQRVVTIVFACYFLALATIYFV